MQKRLDASKIFSVGLRLSRWVLAVFIVIPSIYLSIGCSGGGGSSGSASGGAGSPEGEEGDGDGDGGSSAISVSISAAPGTSGGKIDISVDFPADVSRFQEVKLLRKTGASAPADCTDGTTISTLTSGQFTDATITDSSLAGGGAYSYLACATDISSNVTSTDVAAHKEENVLARPYTMFITANQPSGNLGGLTGADAICQAEATGNGLPGNWKAILSATGVNARDRIVVSGTVVNNEWNGNWANSPQVITDDAATELFSAALDAQPGCQANEDCSSVFFVFTGSNADGTAHANNCSDWTSASGAVPGRIGMNTIPANWLTGGNGNCNQTIYSLYCIDGQ